MEEGDSDALCLVNRGGGERDKAELGMLVSGSGSGVLEIRPHTPTGLVLVCVLVGERGRMFKMLGGDGSGRASCWISAWQFCPLCPSWLILFLKPLSFLLWNQEVSGIRQFACFAV